MITARLLTVLAASSLAGIANAQTQPAPSSQPNAPPGYSTAKPHQRQMRTVPGNEAAPPKSRAAPGSGLNTPETGAQASSQQNRAESMKLAEAGPGGGARSWENLPVESPSGQSLGSVSKVIPGLNGRRSSGYVVVSGANGTSVPVPYRTAHAMVRGGKLVLNQSRFEHAPKVTEEDLSSKANRAWRIKADRYWMHEGRSRTRK